MLTSWEKITQKRPQFIDIGKELSNIVLTKGQPFWDDKRFKSYE